MNYNLPAYSIFLLVVCFIIIVVGRYFYSNGRVFIISLFRGNVAQADQVNKLLLIAYYLFNIGYAFMKLRSWVQVRSLEMLVSSLATNIGVLIFILAVTHYFNLLIIYRLSKPIQSLHKNSES